MPMLSWIPPVWFVQNGAASGTAVLVNVRPLNVPNAVVETRLLTVQHVLRVGDQRTGSYAAKVKVWAPTYGFVDKLGIDAVPDMQLTVPDTTPLVDEEDIAFLKLPRGFTGGESSGLLADDECKPGLTDLTVHGYISGQDLIDVHKGVVHSAPFEQLKYDNLDALSGIGILTGSDKAGPGVSGGAVCSDARLAGLYRGQFASIGQQVFMPITHVRRWCLKRGFELVDLSLGTQVSTITRGIVEIESLKNDPAVAQQLDSARGEMKTLKQVLAEFLLCKMLHDHLHLIQKYYANAFRASRSSTFADDLVLSTFTDASTGMEEETAKTERTIRDIPATFATLSADSKSWHAKLKASVALASGAGDSANQESAQKACRELGRLLRKTLPDINEELVKKARAMGLDRLASLFGGLAGISTLAANVVQALTEGQSACIFARSAIASRMDMHDCWQELDSILWDAEQAVISEDIDSFKAQWQDITDKLAPLITANGSTEWARKLDAQRSTIAILSVNPTPWTTLPRKFETFSRDLRNRFFWVDLDLKDRAENVAELGKPLELLT